MNKDINTRKMIYFTLICIVLIVIVITGTYAYFTAKKTAEKVLVGETKNYSFGLSVEKVSTNDHYGLIPMDDEKAAYALENNCQDMNGFAVCQIYKITVNNTGNTAMYLDGYLKLDTVNDDEMRFMRIYYDGDEFCYSNNCKDEFNINNIKSGIVKNEDDNLNRSDDKNALLVESSQENEDDIIKSGEKKEYYVLIWLHNLNEKQDDLQGVEHFFSGQAIFISSQGNEITAVF